MKPCNHVHVLAGSCVLPLGHTGPHRAADGYEFEGKPLRDYHEDQKILLGKRDGG